MNRLAEELDEKLRNLDPARARHLESLVREALDRAEQSAENVERPPQGELPGVEWTDEKNSRRCALIDRKIQGVLSEDEADELEQLQEAVRRHVNHVGPLPIDAARRLHAELVKKQQAK